MNVSSQPLWFGLRNSLVHIHHYYYDVRIFHH